MGEGGPQRKKHDFSEANLNSPFSSGIQIYRFNVKKMREDIKCNVSWLPKQHS